MNSENVLSAQMILPQDVSDALLVGRVWSKDAGGPCPVLLKNDRLLDLSSLSPTLSGLLEIEDLTTRLEDTSRFADLGAIDAFLNGAVGELLAPVDLQALRPQV